MIIFLYHSDTTYNDTEPLRSLYAQYHLFHPSPSTLTLLSLFGLSIILVFFTYDCEIFHLHH